MRSAFMVSKYLTASLLFFQTGSMPLVLTGSHVRVKLEEETRTQEDRFPLIIVTVNATYGTLEARDQLKATTT